MAEKRTIAEELRAAAVCGLSPDPSHDKSYERRLRVAIDEAATALEASDLRAEAAIRERDEARAALQWFVDREAPIQHKFNLHGPEDTATAMMAAFRAARAALSQSDGDGQ